MLPIRLKNSEVSERTAQKEGRRSHHHSLNLHNSKKLCHNFAKKSLSRERQPDNALDGNC